MDLPTIIALVGIIGAGVGVWVRLNSKISSLEAKHDVSHDLVKHLDAAQRVTRLETQLEHTDRQFTRIYESLQRIETKLDGKADRA